MLIVGTVLAFIAIVYVSFKVKKYLNKTLEGAEEDKNETKADEENQAKD